ncbi:MAG: glyoxylate/hydroxypyruvate reductase A [Pseudomonadota bacterium]
MSNPTLPFVSQSEDQERKRWVKALSAEMPEENIVMFEDLSQADLEAAKVAIVADPNPEWLKSMPNLVFVQSLWAGVEKMMAEIGTAPYEVVRLEDPEMAEKMAEAILAWVLYIHRDIPTYAAQQRQKIWRELDHTPAFGRRIGLIGLGKLGARAAEVLSGLGFSVAGWSRSPKTIPNVDCFHGSDALHTMLSTVDIAVCVIPLTSATRHIVDEAALAAMPKGSKLINFARGPIVDTTALLAALNNDHLAHAVLDVFDEEPLPLTSPLWDHPKVTLLPHISAPTNRQTGSKIVASNIRAFRRDGTVPASVDRVRGY